MYKPKSTVSVTGIIDGPTEADSKATEVDGTFSFDAISKGADLSKYEITNTVNCYFVKTSDKNGPLSGKSDGRGGLPIKIQLSGAASTKASITIKAYDVNNGTDQTTAEHTVVLFNAPAPAESGGGRDVDPNSTGKIGADPVPGGTTDKFNVTQGIPTHETLYTQAGGKRYLYDYHYQQVSKTKDYPITVQKTFHLTWEEEVETGTDPDGNPITEWQPREDTQVISQPYTIKRNYSYWMVDSLNVFKMSYATMDNYALPGTVTMYPQTYNAPSVVADHHADEAWHLTEPKYPNPYMIPDVEEVSGGQNGKPNPPTEDWRGDAEKQILKIKVRNDDFSFDNLPQKRMDSAWQDETTQKPLDIPAPAQYTDADRKFYQNHLYIDTYKINKLLQPSSGNVHYTPTGTTIPGSAPDVVDNIDNINPVTVHTPTVAYFEVADDRPHNQMTVPDTTRRSLILTRDFKVFVPTNGQHQTYQNYGNRDYAEYIASRQVWFPFDVYMDKQWKKAGQWLTIPKAYQEYTFTLPVWVNEGDYDVKFRSLAENSPIKETDTTYNNPSQEENQANLNLAHHIATKVLPVKVIGRLFDFKITDVADYNWELVFRPAKGSRDILPNRSYWIGDQDFNGDKRNPTVAPPFELPLGPNSSPLAGYGYNAVKTGYHFKFDMKTVGNMYGLTDGVRITPTFSFVTKDGKTRYDNVDLYYSTNSNPFIKIGSPEDTQQRQLVLNTPLRNVTPTEFTDTATFLYDRVFNDLGRSKAGDRTLYISNYLYKAEKPTAIGTAYSWQLLASGVRTFIGTHNPDAGDAALANASVQKWYGEYSLPAAVKVVRSGTDLSSQNSLDDHSPIWLKNGYIIVNFNIETIQNGNTSAPHLQYIHGPLDNQWHMEGMRSSFADADGNTFQIADGDVLYYHADQSSYDDLGTYVPH
nr:DUF5704 domain-containing protein [Tumebacillus amylolyticus]